MSLHMRLVILHNQGLHKNDEIYTSTNTSMGFMCIIFTAQPPIQSWETNTMIMMITMMLFVSEWLLQIHEKIRKRRIPEERGKLAKRRESVIVLPSLPLWLALNLLPWKLRRHNLLRAARLPSHSRYGLPFHVNKFRPHLLLLLLHLHFCTSLLVVNPAEHPVIKLPNNNSNNNYPVAYPSSWITLSLTRRLLFFLRIDRSTSANRYSCMIQFVFSPLGAFPV